VAVVILHVYKYMKLITNKFTFKSGGLHEKRVVATWNLGNHLSISLGTVSALAYRHRETKKNLCRGKNLCIVLPHHPIIYNDVILPIVLT
jgi:hypothetical protein